MDLPSPPAHPRPHALAAMMSCQRRKRSPRPHIRHLAQQSGKPWPKAHKQSAAIEPGSAPPDARRPEPLSVNIPRALHPRWRISARANPAAAGRCPPAWRPAAGKSPASPQTAAPAARLEGRLPGGSGAQPAAGGTDVWPLPTRIALSYLTLGHNSSRSQRWPPGACRSRGVSGYGQCHSLIYRACRCGVFRDPPLPQPELPVNGPRPLPLWLHTVLVDAFTTHCERSGGP